MHRLRTDDTLLYGHLRLVFEGVDESLRWRRSCIADYGQSQKASGEVHLDQV